MQLTSLLDSLAYNQSPNYLTGNGLSGDLTYSHLFRQAQRECGLHGVYSIGGASNIQGRGTIPFVYVCTANTEAEAREIHRKVWNQNNIPFVLVVSPAWARLYPGFHYESQPSGGDGAIRVLHDLDQVGAELAGLSAREIDSGQVWARLGREVTPEKRVDWKLLGSLGQLDQFLASDGLSDRMLAHSMIGKLVYLHYLRERDILSDARLNAWGLELGQVLTRDARMEAFVRLVEKVDAWLNGSMFPLSASSIRNFGAERLRKTLGVFQGDTIGGQPALFDLYDFSFVPIETLSVIYEMFLHESKDGTSGKSKGQNRGAYYTPVPLVNFLIDQMDTYRPLRPGMRVWDPSCGSGAFLVQCYRKLIERQMAALGRPLKLTELRDLLTKHVFGSDVDEDACSIAELSLALTLLEYVHPPDLTSTNFRLPHLRNENIFVENAFSGSARCGALAPFDWVIGNPPWKEIKPAQMDSVDAVAWHWIQQNRAQNPIGGNQLAEAFAWRAAGALAPGGCGGLVLPAMTLFKSESRRFRELFFGASQIRSVANFANLSDVMFAGRASLPAATLTFEAHRSTGEQVTPITVYSPFVATQMGEVRGRQNVWHITVNGADVRELDYSAVSGGSPLPWKTAMWGTEFDTRILDRIERRFPCVHKLERSGILSIGQGPELRGGGSPEKTPYHPELVGRSTIDTSSLKQVRKLIRLPALSFVKLGSDEVYLRREGGLRVCEPPLIFVTASRTIAVFSNEYIVVPARQIGIRSPQSDVAFLKALTLYLNSDFVTYHQFLTATESGIQKTRSTLAALRNLPVPLPMDALRPWVELHARIAARSSDTFAGTPLADELNQLTYEALKLDRRSRASVHDLVHVKMNLTRGKVPQAIVRPPTTAEWHTYATALRDELDAFFDDSPTRNELVILRSGDTGLVAITLHLDTRKQFPVKILSADAAGADHLRRAQTALVEQKSQWVYFQRNLIAYEGNQTFLMKPAKRLYWTVSEAISDAGTLIADAITAPLPDPPLVAAAT